MPAYDRIRQLLGRGDAVLMDGGMGSELVRRGVRWRWHGLRTDGAQVRALHDEYVAAGADVIRTNTLQLNRRIYQNVFRNADHMRHIGAPGVESRAEELTRTAVELARAARDGANGDAAVAGVMSPLEHCYRPDLAPAPEVAEREHREVAGVLAEEGVDLLLLESMNTIGEASAATRVARETGLPVWVSFVIGPEGELLSGESLVSGVEAVRDAGAEAVLVNCAPPEDISAALERVRAAADCPVGAYAHIGKFDPPSWKFEFHPQFTGIEVWPPSRYREAALGWREIGAQILGGCCGTTPEHIRALREAL